MIDLSGYVFQGFAGKMVYDAVVNKAISNTIKRMNAVGVETEHFSAHALRDTFATRYIEQGGSPQVLKTILGHSSLSMTMDLYSHVLPNKKKEEMDSIRIAFYEGRRCQTVVLYFVINGTVICIFIPQFLPQFIPQKTIKQHET